MCNGASATPSSRAISRLPRPYSPAAADAAQRLAIHLRHYRTSLVTAVMGRFPATGWLVGTPLLEEAAAHFVREHPPSAPCIGEYGQRFPGFLAAWPGAERVTYLRAFADLDWHLGRLALAVDLPVVTRDDLAAVEVDALGDAVLTLQPGMYYAHADWPIDELMTLYLSDAAPAQFALADTRVWIEVRGARGSFRFSRLTAAEFSFRVGIAEGLSLGDAAQRAWDIDPAFDPGSAWQRSWTRDWRHQSGETELESSHERAPHRPPVRQAGQLVQRDPAWARPLSAPDCATRDEDRRWRRLLQRGSAEVPIARADRPVVQGRIQGAASSIPR